MVPRRVVLVQDAGGPAACRTSLAETFPSARILVCNGAETFDSELKTDDLDVVIVSPWLSWTNGMDVLRAVREKNPVVGTLFVVTSEQEGAAIAAMSEGLDDFVLATAEHRPRLPVAVRGVAARARERRRALASAERTTRLLNTLRVGMFRSSPDGIVRWCNDAMADILGQKRAEALRNTNIVDYYVDEADRDALLEQVQSDGTVREFEVQMRRSDGRVIWVSLTETAAKTDGELFFEGLLEDITDRKNAEQALLTSQRRLWSVIEGAPVSIFVTDSAGRISLCEGRGLTAVGLSSSELVGNSVDEVFEAYPDMRELVALALANASETRVITMGNRSFETWVSPRLSDAGEVVGMTAVQTDITPRIDAERSLRDREHLLQAIVDAEPECICLLNRDGEIREMNPAGLAMLEVEDRGAAIGTYFDTYMLPQYRVAFRGTTEAVFAGHSEILEVEIVGRKGTKRWLEFHGVPLRNALGNVLGLLGIARNVTDRKQAEEQLVHDALHDALTGLPNRTLFHERLSRAVQLARRRASFQFAVLFLDMDRFKVIVDGLGHTASDALLVAIARRLESCVNPGDTVARLGGDEFTVLIEDITTVTEATQIADKIQKSLTVPFRVNGQEVFSTASIGIAFSGTGYVSPEEVLRDADTAMFRAKAQGRARYQLFDTNMHVQAVSRLQIETDMRRALERDEFVLHYQPVVDTHTGHVRSFEALIRWQHPERGLVGPGAFVPIAEETGLIVDIGEWVLRHACQQLHAWRQHIEEAAEISVAVNVSARQFAQPDLIERIDTIIQETGIDAQSLTLEITETALVEEADTATELLNELRSRGFKINIDDFGTGYCSLSYLHRLPADGLKIDGSFVQGMGNTQNAEIVRSVLMLASNLGMNVVAEGAETVEQMSELRQMGCTRCQGYYFSKPLPPDEAGMLIERPFVISE